MTATGKWSATIETPMGPQTREMTFNVDGHAFTGTVSAKDGPRPISGKVDGNKLTWSSDVTDPMPLTLDFDVTVTGDALAGTVKLGNFGNATVKGTRIG